MSTLLLAWAPPPIHFDLPQSFFWLIWAGFLALIVLMFAAKARELRRRRAGLQQFAMERGFQYSEKPEDASVTELAQIHLNGIGLDPNPRYRNILRGSTGGLDTVIADRTVGSGKSQSTSTIVAFKLAAALPEFVVYPESGLLRVVEKFGYSDIDFDGAPDFSRRFFLHGKDGDAVREVFTPAVTSAFEQLDPKARFAAGSSGPWLVYYLPNRLIPVAKLADFLAQTEPLASAFRHSQRGGF